MGADIPKMPSTQETPSFRFTPRATELTNQLSQLTGRPTAEINQETVRASRANRPTHGIAGFFGGGQSDRAASASVVHNPFDVERYLSDRLAQERARVDQINRQIASGSIKGGPTPVTPLPAVKSPAAPSTPAAGGPPARSAAEVQKAAEEERRRVSGGRGRSSTVLTPFDIPIPTGNIFKTVLGGR